MLLPRMRSLWCFFLVLNPALGAVLFNVGLPRTGTTSIHAVMPMLNFSSVHVVFQKKRVDVINQLPRLMKQFRHDGSGTLRSFYEQFDAFSDTPGYGLIPAIKASFPNTGIVATSRSKESWINSMLRNSNVAGKPLMRYSQLVDPDSTDTSLRTRLEIIYDTHAALLDKFDIPRIDVAASDKEKFAVLLSNLPDTKVTRVASKCLSMGTLEWPHANSGHAEHFGASRVIPNMTGASLSNFSATCTLGYDDGPIGAHIIYPIDRHPGSSPFYLVTDTSGPAGVAVAHTANRTR